MTHAITQYEAQCDIYNAQYDAQYDTYVYNTQYDTCMTHAMKQHEAYMTHSMTHI